jgi:hypothetical protein
MQEFDQIEEGELSKISRLAAEREDNMMWKEFREKLLLNIGLVSAHKLKDDCSCGTGI